MQPMMNKLWWIIDLIFPWPQPQSSIERACEEKRRAQAAAECDARIAGLPNDPAELNEYLAAYTKMLDAERASRQSIEARLTSIIGTLSIAGTILFGGILALAAGTLKPHTDVLRSAIAITCLYLIVQMCGAILAAVRGLARRGYEAERLADVLPCAGETTSRHLRNKLHAFVIILQCYRTQNNAKVTQMAVAHRAMLNFLGGLLVLALIGTWHGINVSRNNDLLEFLKQNDEVRELLRGPQGPPGPTGPKGEPGAPAQEKEACIESVTPDGAGCSATATDR